jgi:hypothetical protein
MTSWNLNAQEFSPQKTAWNAGASPFVPGSGWARPDSEPTTSSGGIAGVGATPAMNEEPTTVAKSTANSAASSRSFSWNTTVKEFTPEQKPVIELLVDSSQELRNLSEIDRFVDKYEKDQETGQKESESVNDVLKQAGVDSNGDLRVDALHNLWNLWVYVKDNLDPKATVTCMSECGQITTVQEFWRLMHHLKLPSDFWHKQSYSEVDQLCIFKNCFFPARKCEECKGCWKARFPVSRMQMSKCAMLVDAWWLTCLLNMIGENFDSQEICGLLVRTSTDFVSIELWLSETDDDSILNVGQKFYDFLRNEDDAMVDSAGGTLSCLSDGVTYGRFLDGKLLYKIDGGASPKKQTENGKWLDV